MKQVEFNEGEATELTTNIIAQSMHTQCDAVGNTYLLLDVRVDYCKDNKMFLLQTNRLVYRADQ